MGAKTSHHSQLNGDTAVNTDKRHKTKRSKAESSTSSEAKKRGERAENNNLSEADYTYNITDKKQCDARVQLTLENSAHRDPHSTAVSPLSVHVMLESATQFHFKVLKLHAALSSCFCAS